MTLRTVENNNYNLYDSADDLENVEYQLTLCCYILGITEIDIDSVTIDDILEAVNDVYGVNLSPLVTLTEDQGLNGLVSEAIISAANAIVNKRNRRITWVSRRVWRWVQIVRYNHG